MSGNKNPTAALAALTHPATTKVGRFEVHELFLGTLAILERIDSPLLNKDAPRTLSRWCETLYVLTHPAAESAKALDCGPIAFSATALGWAETVTNEEAKELLRAAGEALMRLNAAANTATEEPGEEAGDNAVPDPTADGPTAGSPVL